MSLFLASPWLSDTHIEVNREHENNLFFQILNLLNSFSIAPASLDFDQEILHIPETHESEKYLWDVRNDPEDFKLTLTRTQKGKTGAIAFMEKISPPHGEFIEKVHVFVVDKKFQIFEHIFPVRQGDNLYSFDFTPSKKGTYRVETVLQTNKGWVKLSRNLNAIQSLRYCIDSRLAVTFGFLQKNEIFALDPFISRVVLFHGLMLLISSHCLRWICHAQLIRFCFESNQNGSRIIADQKTTGDS